MHNTAIVEGGKKIKLGKDFKVKSGDYLTVSGQIAVSKISKAEAGRIRNLIKSIYEGK